ncbi:MAG TPA: SH3 domain-containing protein [Azospirillum sp.]
MTGRVGFGAWVMAALLALCAAGPIVGPVAAQSPVAIGAPLEGPVVLNRDVEVRVGPSQDARIIQTMTRGRALNALGTPRGTTWTQVAIGGQPIGYVPVDSLDPVYVPRPMPIPKDTAAKDKDKNGAAAERPSAVGAVVPRAAFDAARNDRAQGYVVAYRNVGATEQIDAKKRKSFTIRKGQVVAVLGVAGNRLTLAVTGRATVTAGVDGFLGVVTAYPLPGVPPVGTGPLYASRLGEFVSYDEGLRAWTEFTGGPGAQYRDRPPMVWPVFHGGKVRYETGVGPFARSQIDGACATLAQGGRDCHIVELQAF